MEVDPTQLTDQDKENVIEWINEEWKEFFDDIAIAWAYYEPTQDQLKEALKLDLIDLPKW